MSIITKMIVNADAEEKGENRWSEGICYLHPNDS